MNLNEKCLLDYLQNPQELESLTCILQEHINLLMESAPISVNTVSKIVLG